MICCFLLDFMPTTDNLPSIHRFNRSYETDILCSWHCWYNLSAALNLAAYLGIDGSRYSRLGRCKRSARESSIHLAHWHIAKNLVLGPRSQPCTYRRALDYAGCPVGCAERQIMDAHSAAPLSQGPRGEYDWPVDWRRDMLRQWILRSRAIRSYIWSSLYLWDSPSSIPPYFRPEVLSESQPDSWPFFSI